MASVPNVSVYLRKQMLFVVSTYSAGPGTYIEKEPALSVAPTEPEEVGRAVLNGLDHFVEGGPWPPDWSTYKSPVLAAAGIATWSEFKRGLRDCSVMKYDDHFLIQSENPCVTLPLNSSEDDVGMAVLASLGLSRP